MRESPPHVTALPHAVHVMKKVIKAIDYRELGNENTEFLT